MLARGCWQRREPGGAEAQAEQDKARDLAPGFSSCAREVGVTGVWQPMWLGPFLSQAAVWGRGMSSGARAVGIAWKANASRSRGVRKSARADRMADKDVWGRSWCRGSAWRK